LFSAVSPVSSTNKTDHHDITEILLKVALNTTALTLLFIEYFYTNAFHSKTVDYKCFDTPDIPKKN
jgi:hypothetical protein